MCIRDRSASGRPPGLKVAMFTFSTPPLSLVGGRKQTVLMTNRERMELLRSAGVDYLVEYPFDQEVCHMAPACLLYTSRCV